MICNKCGWAHFGVTRDNAVNSIDDFLKYYNKLNEIEKTTFYGAEPVTFGSMYRKYLKCFHCGGHYNDFHAETEDDKVPIGVTMKPIVSTHTDAA